MAKRQKCVYCGAELSERSKEHIIHNALGGLLESEDICCAKCNNVLSEKIDVPFTKIFNPIVSNIENFAKTNHKKSKPSYSGKAVFDGGIYDVLIKNDKVVQCLELSKKMKCDISKLDMEIIAHDFIIDNESFKNGFAKIAYNFALQNGISLNILNQGLEVHKKNEVLESIKFKYPIIPFFPLNPLDEYIELHTEVQPYHNLILFSQDDKLWCYVDLFNTFQYYILLAVGCSFKQPIIKTYFQYIQKLDRTIPELDNIRRNKHILCLADAYGVEPCLDLDEFKKRIEKAVQMESPIKDMSESISAKLSSDYFPLEELKRMRETDVEANIKTVTIWKITSYNVYFDENKRIRKGKFRQVTPIKGMESIVESYPMNIWEHIARKGLSEIKSYTFKKFNRLNDFLVHNDVSQRTGKGEC